jgi:hypothetical protein
MREMRKEQTKRKDLKSRGAEEQRKKRTMRR